MPFLSSVLGFMSSCHLSRLLANDFRTNSLLFHSRCVHAQTNQNIDSAHYNIKKFEEKRIQIQTCGDLYRKWQKQGRYWKIPSGDLTFDVRYIDTLQDTTERKCSHTKASVILALHGAPGSYEDYGLLTSHLSEYGSRVIVPCMPDFKNYKPGVFRHSAKEKAQFIKDFLRAINISNIDLLICHSSSVYPGLQLCIENDAPRIKSLALLNPGFYGNTKSTRPFWFMYSMVRASEFPVGFRILKHMGPFLMKVAKSPVRVESMHGPLLSATTMAFANFPKAKENLIKLSSQNFPIFFAFGEDDKLVDKKCSNDMAHLLGAQDKDIYLFDKDGVMVRKGAETSKLTVMAFEKGSHYVFWKHPEIINEAVTAFLRRENSKN